jgi:hypothetical protein
MAKNTHLENLRAEDKSGSDWWFPLKPLLLCLRKDVCYTLVRFGSDESAASVIRDPEVEFWLLLSQGLGKGFACHTSPADPFCMCLPRRPLQRRFAS